MQFLHQAFAFVDSQTVTGGITRVLVCNEKPECEASSEVQTLLRRQQCACIKVFQVWQVRSESCSLAFSSSSSSKDAMAGDMLSGWDTQIALQLKVADHDAQTRRC